MDTEKALNKKIPYIQVPKVLWENERYMHLSIAAILLYALLLDRYKLAARTCNAWRNEQGQVYICYSVAEVKKYMRCGHDKACYLFRELQNVGLIERKRKGLGQESQIIVFLPKEEIEESENYSAVLQNVQSADYRVFRVGKSACNNTNKESLMNENTNDRSDSTSENGSADDVGFDIVHISNAWNATTAFDTFFATYPESKRGSYLQGLTSYRTVVTTPLEASKALEILATWIRSPAWQKNGGQYVPFLANYLTRGYTYRPPLPDKSTQYGSGQLGEAELDAIKKLMRD